jgi:hypothetical protein
MATLLRNLNVAANQSTVISASHALNSNNSLSALNSLTASYATTAITASYAVSAGAADTALTASYIIGGGSNGSNGTSGTSGAAGANGANGTAGSSGTSGAGGASGSSGTSGASGAAGSSGSSGTSGSAGTSGVSGAGGSSGSSGTDGTSGSAGTSGVSGSSGSTGSSGSSGTSGVSGAGGSSGTSGTSGTDGTSGSSGSTGTSGSAGTSGSSGTAGSSGANGSSGTSGTAGSSGNSVSVTTSDTAPVDPYTGSLWWDTTTGDLKVYYFNGTGSWVAASSAVSGTAGTSGTNGNFITGSLYNITSSWAVTSSYALNAVSASHSTTASYALNAVSASYAPNIYVLPSNVVSASAQLSNGGGTAFTNSNNITVGQITASAISVTALSVVTITSSIAYASGSNIFGTKSTDTQLFTGSVNITGSLGVVGNITSNNVLSLAAGTVLLPSLILATDTTSGMYRIGANNIGIAISAAKVLDISSTGLSVTGALSATNGYNGTVGATTPSTVAATSIAIGTNAVFGGTLTQINGSNVVIANTAGQFSIGTTNAAAADMGGSLGFTANTTSLAGYPMGNISARLIATGAGVYRSYMAFATTDAAGSVAERMRLTDTGLNSTAIGATTPSTGAFTTLSASTSLNLGSASGGTTNTVFRLNTSTAANFEYRTATTRSWVHGLREVGDSNYHFYSDVAGGDVMVLTPTGVAVTGALSSTTGANFATSSGNVGVGTASPASKLHVATSAGSGATIASFGSTTNVRIKLINEDATYGATIQSDAGSPFFLVAGGAGSGANLALGANGTEVVRIAGTNVGIGTTSPGSKLDVNGELRIGNTVNTVSPTSPNRTVTIVIGGTTYYLAAKTTND